MGRRLLFAVRRQPHLTRDEFQARWFDQHAPLVVAHAHTLGIVRYQQVHTRTESRVTAVPCFDGIAEVWIDPSLVSTDASAVAAAQRALLDDEREFIDHAASPIWFAEEDLHLDGSTDGLRMVAMLRRNPSLTRAQFREHWQQSHGPWALRHPEVIGFRRYVQLHAPVDADDNELALERGAPPAFDGVSEIHRNPPTAPPDEVAALRQQFHEDEQYFLDIDASPVFLGEIRVVIAD